MSNLKSTSKISDLKQDYNPSTIESKWQKVWDQNRIYSPDLDTAKKPFYNLMMFPYPSAEGMHVGNMYAFTGADVYGRFKRMQGFDVFEPMGLDGFGIHSENYAIKVGQHPKEQAKISEKNFYRQLRATGNGFDWSRKVETYDPKYYKWTQWLFIQLFKAGLAYRAKAKVNWCPSCKTVLADEQVVTKVKSQKSKVKSTTQKSKVEETIGVCERCETPVEKKDLEQWFFRITKYADRLLANIAKLDWSEKVKIAQRQWIGRSEGAQIEFKVQSSKFKVEKIEVFTTRPDTLYGATFLVLSPEHPIAAELLNSKFKIQNSKLKQVGKYVEQAKKKTEQERMAEGKDKAGVFSGLYAINPLNQEKIPVWIADYAVMGYGTGALFGDAHDKRDVEFAKKYKIPLKVTVITGDKERDQRIKNFEECFTGYGILIDSGEFSGLTSEEAKKSITAWLKDHKSGGPEITYHLRDWLISRQRYWGPPIPMIYCESCAKKGIYYNTVIPTKRERMEGSNTTDSVEKDSSTQQGFARNDKVAMAGWFPVQEKDLPVLLPDVKDWKPKGTGKSPLACVESFVNTKCPNCKSPAKRETDVSDTFLDSAWYFFRYTSTDIERTSFDRDRVKKWLPVEMYIGGAEHSVLHLLYSRFITMVIHDLGLIEFEEPFSRFYAHGLLIKEGAKMSKSKGNVVVPDQYIAKFGADTLRMYLMFLGPFNQGGDFSDTGIEGMHRFLKRLWRLFTQVQSSKFKVQSSEEGTRMMHRTIKKVTEDISSLRYNTAIASLMTYYNFLSKQKPISKEEAETFLKLIAPFAPHLTEELWQRIESGIKNQESGEKKNRSHNSLFMIHNSIHTQAWPSYDPKFLEEDEVTIVVQVNGKLRDTMKVQSSKFKVQSYIEELAKGSDKIKKYIEGRSIKKVVYVEGKVINFVTD